MRVTANNLVTTGGYNLGLEGIAPTSPDPTPITLGDLLSGTIDAAGEADLFTFAGTAGDVIALTLVETTSWGPTCCGTNDARMTLFSSAGAELAFFDSNGQLEVTLPADGTYLIRVTANNLVSTGSYDLGVRSP